MTPEPTEFQSSCESQLSSLLARTGRCLESRELQPDPLRGVDTPLITGLISGTSFRVYIYSDEAQLHGPEIDHRFEALDFQTKDELTSAFLQAVDNAVAN